MTRFSRLFCVINILIVEKLFYFFLAYVRTIAVLSFIIIN